MGLAVSDHRAIYRVQGADRIRVDPPGFDDDTRRDRPLGAECDGPNQRGGFQGSVQRSGKYAHKAG